MKNIIKTLRKCRLTFFGSFLIYIIMGLKLYAFQPSGHGEASFFTIANSLEEAWTIVNKHVEDNYLKKGKIGYRAGGWGTDYYTVTTVKEGDVIENDND